MTDKRKRMAYAAAAILAICVIGAASYLLKTVRYQRAVKDLTYTEIRPDRIDDGTYVGECDVDFIYVKAAVTVKNGVITDIELLDHKNGRGAPAETVINDIIQHQTLNVDAVSGATNSSRVIMKAVENALKQQPD